MYLGDEKKAIKEDAHSEEKESAEKWNRGFVLVKILHFNSGFLSSFQAIIQ